MNTKAHRRARRGFTIAEIIVVVIIIGVLAAIIVPRLTSRVGQSRVTVAKANAKAIEGALEGMIQDTQWTPTSGVDLASVLMVCPPEVRAESWKGPYFKNADQLKDPWGNQFVLVVPGVVNADFDIVSYGADGRPGGDGDNADIVAK